MARDAQDNHALRLRRSESWSERAKLFYEDNDPDTAFLFYWISFNALYAQDNPGEKDAIERRLQTEFINLLQKLDQDGTLYKFAWSEWSQSIRNLLDNKFIFGPYWKEIRTHVEVSRWQEQLKHDEQKAKASLNQQGSVTRLLGAVFNRLNVLRNQLAHGSATYQGSVNRQQVKTGARFMNLILPIFQEIFRSNPTHDWGDPPYPPQER